MNEGLVDNLTSAEAGFMYAVVDAGEQARRNWTVDDIAAKPVAEGLEQFDSMDVVALKQRLQRARLGHWSHRRTPAKSTTFRRVVHRALRLFGTETSCDGVQKVRGRQLIERALARHGRDLSVFSADVFDLRLLFEETTEPLVGLDLVILGAVLVSSLDQVLVRRRIAAMMRRLPQTVQSEIEKGLKARAPLNEKVARRIYEVYGTIAADGYRTDEQLALVGLYFAISAAIFRHNGELRRFERALPEAMRGHCRRYRRRCLLSGKPELSRQCAEMLQPIVAALADHHDPPGASAESSKRARRASMQISQPEIPHE